MAVNIAFSLVLFANLMVCLLLSFLCYNIYSKSIQIDIKFFGLYVYQTLDSTLRDRHIFDGFISQMVVNWIRLVLTDIFHFLFHHLQNLLQNSTKVREN